RHDGDQRLDIVACAKSLIPGAEPAAVLERSRRAAAAPARQRLAPVGVELDAKTGCANVPARVQMPRLCRQNRHFRAYRSGRLGKIDDLAGRGGVQAEFDRAARIALASDPAAVAIELLQQRLGEKGRAAQIAR